MKKYVIMAAILVASISSSFAQTEKGQFFVSGASDLSFISSKTKLLYDGKKQGSADQNNFCFNTSVAYFVIDNLALGLALDFEHTKQAKDKNNSFLVGPMARYYFGSTNIKPYVEACMGFGSGKELGEDSEAKFKQFGWDAGAGVAFFVNDFVSIDFGVSYGDVKQTLKDDSKAELKTNGFGAMVGVSIFF
ncbi:MAG: outer membrane beta-barrel protein [Draconibacterium sp.]